MINGIFVISGIQMGIYEEFFRDSTWTIHQHLNGLMKGFLKTTGTRKLSKISSDNTGTHIMKHLNDFLYLQSLYFGPFNKSMVLLRLG